MNQNQLEIRIPPEELADWLDRQGPDSWWLVDGDPLLTGLISFPCMADELAAGLRGVRQRLLLIEDDHGRAESRELTADDLDRHALIDGPRDERVFRFRWDRHPPGVEWLLFEDKESPDFAKGIDLEVDR